MTSKNILKKVSLLLSIGNLIVGSLVFGQTFNTYASNAQTEDFTTETITISNDVEIVKKTRNKNASNNNNEEKWTETKISLSDLAKDQMIFYQKDSSGKITKIVIMDTPERDENGKRATSSNADRKFGKNDGKNFAPPQRDGNNRPEGKGGKERGKSNEANANDSNNSSNNNGGRGDRGPNPFNKDMQGNVGLIESISGNTLTLKIRNRGADDNK